MKREIKFRAKDYSNNWVYGNLIHSRRFSGCSNEWRIHDCKGGFESDVFPDTVGQFTGLYDKNSKEIYEGDILKLDCFQTDKGGFNQNAVVIYECQDNNDGTQTSGFYIETIDDNERMCILRGRRIEVIGNIHDNPELLQAN